MDMDSPVTPCVPKSLVVNADHLAVPYHGNRLLSLPGSVACYCYFVYQGIFQGRKLQRVIYNGYHFHFLNTHGESEL